MTAPVLLLDGKPLVTETYDVHLPQPEPRQMTLTGGLL